MKKKYFFTIILILLILLLVILLKKKDKKIDWTNKNSLILSQAPIIDDSNNIESLVLSLNNSLSYLYKQNKTKKINFGTNQYSIKNLIESLEEFKLKLEEYGLSEKFFKYIQENYTFFKTNVEKVLYTGYFEASLRGSLEKTDIYKYPIYKKPEDLVRIELKKFRFFKDNLSLPRVIKGRITKKRSIVPFYSREEIDGKNKLQDLNLEILWVDDQIDLFFLQIQGSGIVEMNDGSKVRLNYSESNGQPYRAIGRYMVDQGYLKLEEVTMQSIKKYLYNNPKKVEKIFNYNPSYVFFRQVERGPIGSIGVPVTPYRSIATDKNIFPRGALCFIKTKTPVFNKEDKIIEWKEFTSFVLNQDTGGAIRTPRRVDLFTGYGKSAELVAGHMKQYGELYFLIKK